MTEGIRRKSYSDVVVEGMRGESEGICGGLVS